MANRNAAVLPLVARRDSEHLGVRVSPELLGRLEEYAKRREAAEDVAWPIGRAVKVLLTKALNDEGIPQIVPASKSRKPR